MARYHWLFYLQSNLHIANQSTLKPEVQRLQQDVWRGGSTDGRLANQRHSLLPRHDHGDPAVYAVLRL